MRQSEPRGEIELESGFGAGLRTLLEHRQQPQPGTPPQAVGEERAGSGERSALPEEARLTPAASHARLEELERCAAELAATERARESRTEHLQWQLVALEAALADVQARLEDQSTHAQARLEEREGSLAQPEPSPPAEETPPASHLLFLPTLGRYELVEGEGAAPPLGSELELRLSDGRTRSFHVSKLGRSPLLADARPCAYLQALSR